MNEIHQPLTAGVIQRISKSEGAPLVQADQVEEYVERPLVRAIKILLDKGIPTYSSSANTEWPEAEVTLRLQTLNSANHEIAIANGGEILEDHRGNNEPYLLAFGMPINLRTPEKNITDWANEIANRFVPQAVLSLEQANQALWKINPDPEKIYDLEEVKQVIVWCQVFDEELELFFLSEKNRELYRASIED